MLSNSILLHFNKLLFFPFRYKYILKFHNGEKSQFDVWIQQQIERKFKYEKYWPKTPQVGGIKNKWKEKWKVFIIKQQEVKCQK